MNAAQRVRLLRPPHGGKIGDDPAEAHLRWVLRVVVRAAAMISPSKLLAPVRARRQLALRAMPSRALPEYLNKEIVSGRIALRYRLESR